jgi:hypothetical protein
MKSHYMTFNMGSQSEIVETNEAKTPKKYVVHILLLDLEFLK